MGALTSLVAKGSTEFASGMRALAAPAAKRAVASQQAERALQQTLGRDVLSLSKRAAEDLRGPTVNFARMRPGLFRGGATSTPQEFETLVKRYDIKTIVSFLDPTNPREIPLIDLEKRLAKEHGVALHYVDMPFGVEPPKESVSKFLQLVNDPATGPVYIHCKLGRDRTGAMAAIERIANEGYSADQALAEMRSFGYNPERDTFLGYLSDFVRKFAKEFEVRKLSVS